MRRPTPSTLGAGTLLVALSLTACAPQEQTQPADTANAAPPSDQATTAPSTADTIVDYRDGQYTATGWYGSAPSHHDVTLTIADDTVTAVNITTPAENETSLGYQQRFAEALPQEVVGRNIDDLTIDRLAGSSGCSEGFMDALAQIKEQAAS